MVDLFRRILCQQAFLVMVMVPCVALAQPVPDKKPSDNSAPGKASTNQPVVVATVDDKPIYAGEVQAMLKTIPRYQSQSGERRTRVEAELLRQLVGRRLVLHYLHRKDQAISHHHVDDAVADLKKSLVAQKRTLDGYLKQQGITEAALRADFEWRLSWESYIKRRITDKVLEDHFNKHLADYDGRQLRIQHMLLKFSAKDRDQRLAEAERIKKQISAGQLSFEDAVQKYSQSPSKKKGGDIGFIHRHGKMVEPFLQAAFQLSPGQISSPVITSFGVHLIRCSELKPGEKKWTDVQDELRRTIILRGFNTIVGVERQQAQVHFTGRGAYLDPETGELRSGKAEHRGVPSVTTETNGTSR